MSPTSYQTAPPRGGPMMIAIRARAARENGGRRGGGAGRGRDRPRGGRKPGARGRWQECRWQESPMTRIDDKEGEGLKAVRFVDPNGETRIGRLNDATITDAGAAPPTGFLPTETAWRAIEAAGGPQDARIHDKPMPAG